MPGAGCPRRTFVAQLLGGLSLLDPRAVAQWKVPDGMTCEVHQFEPHEGGRRRHRFPGSA